MMHCFEFPGKRVARQSNSIQLVDFPCFRFWDMISLHFQTVYSRIWWEEQKIKSLNRPDLWLYAWTLFSSINRKGQTFRKTSTITYDRKKTEADSNATYPCNDIETEYRIFDGVYLIFQFDHIGPLTVSFSSHVTNSPLFPVRNISLIPSDNRLFRPNPKRSNSTKRSIFTVNIFRGVDHYSIFNSIRYNTITEIVSLNYWISQRLFAMRTIQRTISWTKKQPLQKIKRNWIRFCLLVQRKTSIFISLSSQNCHQFYVHFERFKLWLIAVFFDEIRMQL